MFFFIKNAIFVEYELTSSETVIITLTHGRKFFHNAFDKNLSSIIGMGKKISFSNWTFIPYYVYLGIVGIREIYWYVYLMSLFESTYFGLSPSTSTYLSLILLEMLVDYDRLD
jgi:hypothetical protein